MALDDPRMTASAIVLQGRIPNLGNAGDTALFASPEAGYIKEVHCIREAAGGSGTSDLQITTPSGAVTPVMTLVTAGAAGDVDSFEVAREDANNYLAAGAGFSIDTDGDFGGTPPGVIIVVVEPY